MVQPRLSEHKIGHIEEIEWVDSEGKSGWDSISAYHDEIGGPLSCVSIGYFIFEDELTVSLVQSHDLKNGSIDSSITIPKCAIKKRVRFKTRLKQPK